MSRRKAASARTIRPTYTVVSDGPATLRGMGFGGKSVPYTPLVPGEEVIFHYSPQEQNTGSYTPAEVASRHALIERIAAENESNTAPWPTSIGGPAKDPLKTISDFLQKHQTAVMVTAIGLAAVLLSTEGEPDQAPRQRKNPRRGRRRKKRTT